MLARRSIAQVFGAIAGAALAALPMTAHAILVGPGDGTQDTAQGSAPNGFNYVGTVDQASGVYLGNGWVITADHIGAIFPATPFTLASYGTYLCNGNVVRLTNADSSVTDLQMFQIAGTLALPLPAVPNLNIASATPAAGTLIYMVGDGRSTRDASPTYYDVTGSPSNPTWTPEANPANANVGGFFYNTDTQTMRWGTSQTAVDPSNGMTTVIQNIGNGNTTCLYTNFYQGLADYLAGGTASQDTSEEGAFTGGDSGGGDFTSDDTLVGLNAYVDGYINEPFVVGGNGQDNYPAIFGEGLYPIDLAAYQSEIQSIMVPEPSGALLAAAMIFPLLARRRRLAARK